MIRISDFHVPYTEEKPLCELVAKRLKLAPRDIDEVLIVRRALDARRYKGAKIEYVYVLDIVIKGEEKKILKKFNSDKRITISPALRKNILPNFKKNVLKNRPIVIGFGPAGMMAALTLARAGLAPLVLERGANVDERNRKVKHFWKTGKLDETTNVQFGEGGAGTFSDGKLTTRISDSKMDEVLADFVRFGAPEEIRYLHKPHIGTDNLCRLVKNIRQEVIRLGGEVKFLTKVTDIEIKNKTVTAVIVNEEERIETNAIFLALGHSARDTYEMLYNKGIIMEAKPFAVGVRIEHPQEIIAKAQYGKDYKDERLPVADYALTYKDVNTQRGAYSFCMCPGGQVVAAASEYGHVVTNGMSFYARNGNVANAAILVNVRTNDFGESVLGGIEFQRKYESLAFKIAGSSYAAPVQSVGDFLLGKTGSKDFCISPTYRPEVKVVKLHEALPSYVVKTIREALPFWDNKMKGFASVDVPLTGVEMRSSAPCRICRDRETFEAIGVNGLYPSGEGAGYAGGIMSASVDGVNVALAFLTKLLHTINVI